MGSFHPADQLPRRQCSKKPLNTMRERGPKGPPVPDPNGSCSASGGAQRPPPPQDGRLLRGDAAARHLQQLPLRGGGPAAPRRVPRRRHWPRRGLPYRAPPLPDARPGCVLVTGDRPRTFLNLFCHTYTRGVPPARDGEDIRQRFSMPETAYTKHPAA